MAKEKEKLVTVTAAPPKIDMAAIAANIEKLFKEGYNDEEIAKELDLTEQRVAVIQSMLGLSYRASLNVFEQSRAIRKNAAAECFFVPAFSLPNSIYEKLRIDWKGDYDFFASVIAPKTIQITLLERTDK